MNYTDLLQCFIATGSLKFFLFLFDELSKFLYVSFQSFFQILGIGIQFLAFCKKIFFVFIFDLLFLSLHSLVTFCDEPCSLYWNTIGYFSG